MDTPNSENEYWRSVTPVDEAMLFGDESDNQHGAPATRSAVGDTPRPPRTSTAANPAFSFNNLLPRFMQNLSLSALASTSNDESAGSGSASPPESPTMPGGLLQAPVQSTNAVRETALDSSPVLGPALTASGFLPYPPLTPEMRAQLAIDSQPPPEENISFLPSRDTRDSYDSLLEGISSGIEHELIAHHRKVKELDRRGVGFGVQLELARGVQNGRWTWDDVTPSRMNKLKGAHAAVMPALNRVMDCDAHEPVHHAAALWQELDREQKAIVENKGRGLGLEPGVFEGAEDWYGGRIQLIARLDARAASARAPHFVLEAPEMKRSYDFAREHGSRRLLVLKTAPPPPADSVQKSKHYEPPLALFARKFVLMGRVFVPFDAKDGHVYAVETDEDFERVPVAEAGDGLRQSFEDFVRMHNPPALNYRQPIAKWATRFDLGLSTTIPVLEFNEENIFYIEDIVAEGTKPGSGVAAEKIMTDGAGFMNGAAILAISKRIHLPNRPSALQGRIAGSKGLWVLHPTDRSAGAPPRIWIRRSQHKIVLHALARGDRIFALLQPARVFAPGHLSVQLILNMAHNGVPVAALYDLLDAGLRAEAAPFAEWEGPHAMALLWAAVARAGNVPAMRLRRILPEGVGRAMGLAGRLDAERSFHSSGGSVNTVVETESQSDIVELDPSFVAVTSDEHERGRGPPDNLHETVMELLQAGFRPQESAYLCKKIKYILQTLTAGYINKYRVLVPRSAEAFMIPDPIGLLEEGQVHFRSSKELGEYSDESDPHIILGDVLISRHPTTVASDIRKARAVNVHPAYESYVNVIIMPTKGSRSFASWLGGGDYDGDLAMITWEPTLVEPFSNAPLVEPEPDFRGKNFDSSGVAVPVFCERLASKPETRGAVLLDVLLQGARDRRVGLYSHFYMLSVYHKGYDHPVTEHLAHMFVTCLDANKTGLRPRPEVFKADSSMWWQRVPACLSPRAKHGSAAFDADSSFIFDLIRSKCQALENDLLANFHKLASEDSSPDDSLLEPAHRAEVFAQKMRRDHKLDLWIEDLDGLRGFVDRIRNEWTRVATPGGPGTTEDRNASIAALAVRFAQNAPPMQNYAMYSTSDLSLLRASIAYATAVARVNDRSELNDTFAFAVAFKDLCILKSRSEDAASIVRSLSDFLTMQKSTRLALGDIPTSVY